MSLCLQSFAPSFVQGCKPTAFKVAFVGAQPQFSAEATASPFLGKKMGLMALLLTAGLAWVAPNKVTAQNGAIKTEQQVGLQSEKPYAEITQKVEKFLAGKGFGLKSFPEDGSMPNVLEYGFESKYGQPYFITIQMKNKKPYKLGILNMNGKLISMVVNAKAVMPALKNAWNSADF